MYVAQAKSSFAVCCTTYKLEQKLRSETALMIIEQYHGLQLNAEAAALRFMNIYIYLIDCFTGKTGRPSEMANDTAIVQLQSVAIRVKFTRTIKKLQNTPGVTKTRHGAAVAAASVTAPNIST